MLMNALRYCHRKVRRLLWHWCNRFSRPGLHTWVRECCLTAEAPTLVVGAGGIIGELLKGIEHLSIDIAPERNPDIVLDVCKLTSHLGPETFQTIFMIEVLEHVADPFAAIKEIYSALRPGGKLFLSVPFGLEEHDIPHDYWRFTSYGLRDLLAEFEDVKIEPRGGYASSCLTPFLRLTFQEHYTDQLIGAVALAIAIPVYPFLKLLDFCVKSRGYASGYHVIARKRLEPSADLLN